MSFPGEDFRGSEFGKVFAGKWVRFPASLGERRELHLRRSFHATAILDQSGDSIVDGPLSSRGFWTARPGIRAFRKLGQQLCPKVRAASGETTVPTTSHQGSSDWTIQGFLTHCCPNSGIQSYCCRR
jgi:hypothetical protein